MLRRIASFANHLSLTLRVVLGSTVVLVGVAAALTWRATEANQKAVIQQLEARTRGAMNLTIARLQAFQRGQGKRRGHAVHNGILLPTTLAACALTRG
ncbi:hypothetical protein [Roseococcus thiosulfatophilus]|uniref:hypothetical protein n=1 Tax=Roseococcus thiosulfatophilus TaxID=35813 RepID=UPI001A8E32F9|nr:hypothetical protein [Roseococcus thiosulfatophilus]